MDASHILLIEKPFGGGFPGGSAVKNLPGRPETWLQTLGQEDPLEKEMAMHSSILAWEIPWTDEPGRLHRVAKSWTQLKRLSMHACTLWSSFLMSHGSLASPSSNGSLVPIRGWYIVTVDS